jgi:Protein of unknown function (DUF2860)
MARMSTKATIGSIALKTAHVIFLVLASAAIASAEEPPRPWDLSLRFFTGYDSNVPLVPKSTDFQGRRATWTLGAGAEGSYKFLQEKQWELGAGGSFVQTWNNNNLSSFDLTSFNPRLFGAYFFQVGTLPGQVGMAYDFRHDLLGGNEFENSHTLSWDVTVLPTPHLSTAVYYHLAFEDFLNDGNNPPLTSRDAVNHAVGANATYSFGYNKPSIGLNYQFSHNNADGQNFTFDSHAVSVRFITPVIRPVKLVLEAGYSSQDYTKFTPQPVRTQDNQNYGATFLIPLSRHLSADVGYKFARYIGSQTQFSAERHIVTVGLTYDFR